MENFILFIFLNYFFIFAKASLNKSDKNSKSKACAQFLPSLLTIEEKNLIVGLHNHFRESLMIKEDSDLPRGFYILKLSWNETLAGSAQLEANKCSFEMSPMIGHKPGQNVVVADFENEMNLVHLIRKWEAGKHFLTPPVLTYYSAIKGKYPTYEPAAQILWAETTSVGCGRSVHSFHQCPQETDSSCNVYKLLIKLVCNYYPPGNQFDKPVFKTRLDNNLYCDYEVGQLLCKRIEYKVAIKKESAQVHQPQNIAADFNKKIWSLSSGISLLPNYETVLILLFVLKYFLIN